MTKIIQTEESPKKVRIVSDSQSVLLHIANLQPAIPLMSVDKSDILISLVALHDEWHQIAFTWCPSHCGVVGNEIADKQVRKGAAANQEGVQHQYNSAKPAIRHVTSMRKISHERICRVYGAKGEKLDHRDESKLSRKEQTTMGRLISGHHLNLKYWLY